MRRSLVAVHTLLAVDDGAFVSLLDPPPDAADRRRRLPQRRHVPRARRRRGGASRPRAVVADHPLRPSRGGARERGRLLRRDRDRRDPGPAGADPHRRREGRGSGHRPPVGRHHRPLRRHGARRVGTAARHRPSARCGAAAAEQSEPLPWWDPGVDGAVDPSTDTVWIGGVEVGKGDPRPSPPLEAGRRPRPLPRRA